MYGFNINMFLLRVDELLKITELDIIVYQGQLDLICSSKGEYV